MKECKYNGCDRKAYRRGWCSSHYLQLLNGQALRPLKRYKKYVAPAPGLKVCTSCERVRDVETEFYTRTTGRPAAWCKECAIERSRLNYQMRKEAVDNGSTEIR